MMKFLHMKKYLVIISATTQVRQMSEQSKRNQKHLNLSLWLNSLNAEFLNWNLAIDDLD